MTNAQKDIFAKAKAHGKRVVTHEVTKELESQIKKMESNLDTLSVDLELEDYEQFQKDHLFEYGRIEQARRTLNYIHKLQGNWDKLYQRPMR